MRAECDLVVFKSVIRGSCNGGRVHMNSSCLSPAPDVAYAHTSHNVELGICEKTVSVLRSFERETCLWPISMTVLQLCLLITPSPATCSCVPIVPNLAPKIVTCPLSALGF
jgi:hypothetical protein